MNLYTSCPSTHVRWWPTNKWGLWSFPHEPANIKTSLHKTSQTTNLPYSKKFKRQQQWCILFSKNNSSRRWISCCDAGASGDIVAGDLPVSRWRGCLHRPKDASSESETNHRSSWFKEVGARKEWTTASSVCHSHWFPSQHLVFAVLNVCIWRKHKCRNQMTLRLTVFAKVPAETVNVVPNGTHTGPK